MTSKIVDKAFLQFYRLKSGLTQSELKEMAGYSNIGKVEHGKVVLSNDDANDKAVIKRIAKSLKIKPEQLLCLDEKAAAENADANKFASLNLCAMRNTRRSSHKEVGVYLGFPEKNAGSIIFGFELGRLMFPPDELTRIATEIFFGDSAGLRKMQKDFLTREFTSEEIDLYSGESGDKFEDTAVSDNSCINSESDINEEYNLHLTDGRVIPVKCSRYGGDMLYEFYLARKKAMLEFLQDDGTVFICRKRDIYYITRKGDER